MDGRRVFLNNPQPSAQPQLDRIGLGAALGAYTIWGFLPVFFKQLAAVPAMEIIAHRIIWAVPLLIAIMALRRQLSEYLNALARWSLLRWMLASAALISVNWLIYVWAVNNDQILAASFGYYLNPLFNVVVGTLFLGERLNRNQWNAVGLAGLGVAVMALGGINTLWISLGLAASFCAYGLVRKMAPVGSVPGLAIETTLLLPVASATAFWYALSGPDVGWGSDPTTTWLMAAGGAITAIPLLLFATAARRMSYSTLGFIQYVGPTLQFLCAVLLYDEPLTLPRVVSFALIWLALGMFSWDAVQRMRSGV
jgi:chloramphenicol-sensitive protein RarD